MNKNINNYFTIKSDYWDDFYKDCKDIKDIILVERKNIIKKYIIDNFDKNSKILDLGGGTGVLSSELIKMGYKVDMLDISKKMIDQAKQKYKNLNINMFENKLICGNFLDLKLENTYNVVTALGFFEYQEDYSKNLNKIYYYLSDNGQVVFNLPIKYNLSNFFGLSKYVNNIKNNFKKNIHPGLKVKNMTEIKKNISNNNMKIINIVDHGYGEIYLVNKILPLNFQKFIARIIKCFDFNKKLSFLKSNRIFFISK